MARLCVPVRFVTRKRRGSTKKISLSKSDPVWMSPHWMPHFQFVRLIPGKSQTQNRKLCVRNEQRPPFHSFGRNLLSEETYRYGRESIYTVHLNSWRVGLVAGKQFWDLNTPPSVHNYHLIIGVQLYRRFLTSDSQTHDFCPFVCATNYILYSFFL